MLTNVYGPNDQDERASFYHQLENIKHSIAEPWILMGDFDITRFASDRLGAKSSCAESRKFDHFINSLELLEINTYN